MAEREPRRDGRLPLIVVGGFLGAGKSSWLRHQLFVRKFGRVHVLVNEAAEVPVDDLLLQGADKVSVLAGGCACCAGRNDLLDVLRRICNENAGGSQNPVDTIVLETSGIADPAAIARAIMEDPVLVRRIVLAQTIVLVDAVDAQCQLREEPLARAQIEAADRLVVTKTSDADPGNNSRLLATLRRLAPDADVSCAEFGVATEVAETPGALPFELPDIEDQTRPIQAHRLDVGESGSWGGLATWLSALLFVHGDNIVRVKGAVHTPAGRLLLQSVRRHVQPPEILPESDDPSQQPTNSFIVLIGRGIDPDHLRKSWERFVLDADT